MVVLAEADVREAVEAVRGGVRAAEGAEDAPWEPEPDVGVADREAGVGRGDEALDGAEVLDRRTGQDDLETLDDLTTLLHGEGDEPSETEVVRVRGDQPSADGGILGTKQQLPVEAEGTLGVAHRFRDGKAESHDRSRHGGSGLIDGGAAA